MNESEEEMYEKGSRSVWWKLLHQCLKNLDIDDNMKTIIKLTSEREEAILALREICEEYGDNDWDDNLHLADIIEKHLHRHLN